MSVPWLEYLTVCLLTGIRGIGKLDIDNLMMFEDKLTKRRNYEEIYDGFCFDMLDIRFCFP